MKTEFRKLPSVDKLLSDQRIKGLQEKYPAELLTDIIRRELQHVRSNIAAGNPCPSFNEIVDSIYTKVSGLTIPSLRPLINATGVVLHTNLGRAPLSTEALMAIGEASRGYCNLEFDLDTGKRGSRNVHIESVLCELTGAEAALVVNNNASAILLALTALAKRKEVIVSRGQAVQIGGGFRIPDVMRQSGTKLVEVGTTNCTYIADYEQAISKGTAALMRIHSSNFRLMGFTSFVTLEEMVTLSQRYGLPVFDDIGSGCLIDTSQFGLDHEPMMQESIAAGVDLVFASGDKLMGGPQAGVIVGKKQLIDKLKKHPLLRAVRTDKVRLAGLAVTLIHYLKGEAMVKIPVWRMISMPLPEIEKRAERWAKALPGLAKVVEGESMIGGGSLPGSTMPTRLVAIREQGKSKQRNVAQLLGEKLRTQELPVIGRISEATLLLDPRSVLPEDDEAVLRALQSAVSDLKL